ncbi:MAG: tRNA (adenosine(37)-N6)-threonylcarbamoyltransferase complex dimerization subunit type 1 TsaB [Bdellovibrionales bacterium]|nr:tRNA (adenosine(37)-N6)-threonylcarbamoyltransferase complex dimerization subunit type 1 TsaB [Bdellovibrionales bacterium]
MTKSLFLETSSALGGLALVDASGPKPRVVAAREWRRLASHSEVVTASARAVLEQASWKLEDLDFLAVGVGPGSFTGIRVALNMIRAFAYAAHRPVLAFDSLRVLALSSTPQPLPIVTLTNAYKNMLYGARYRWASNNELVEDHCPALWTLDQLTQFIDQPVLCLGDGFEAYQDLLPKAIKAFLIRDSQQPDEPRVEIFSPLLARDLSRASLQDWKLVKPLYIRASEAEEKLRSGLLKPIQKI